MKNPPEADKRPTHATAATPPSKGSRDSALSALSDRGWPGEYLVQRRQQGRRSAGFVKPAVETVHDVGTVTGRGGLVQDALDNDWPDTE